MPEEVNRVLTDQVSDLLFTHSPEAERNLTAEGIDPQRIKLVGNTMIDTLVALEGDFRDRGPARRMASSPARTCSSPCTVRRSSTDRCCAPAIEALATVSQSMPVLFPVHPRTRAALAAAGSRSRNRCIWSIRSATSTSSRWRPTRRPC